MHLLCPVVAGFYSPSYGSLVVASLVIFRHGVMQTKGRAPSLFKLRLTYSTLFLGGGGR